MPKTTLHVDLLRTTIDDFAEHFESIVKNAVRWGKLGGNNISPMATLSWQNTKQEGMRIGYLLGTDFAVRVHSVARGKTGHVWHCDWGMPHGGFILSIMRFRTDRLKLLLHEYNGDGNAAVYEPKLRDWLHKGWGTAIIDIATENAPSLPRLKSERDFILYSLIYWATTRRNPRILQKTACEKTGIRERTYQDKKKVLSATFLGDADLLEMGTSFEELWSLIAAGGSIEEILETDF